MALITNISGVPLYSSIQEALNWGAARGLDGYHTHTFQNQIGYMGGATHNEVNVAAIRRPLTTSRPPTRTSAQPTNTRQNVPVQQRVVRDTQRQLVPEPVEQREVVRQPATQRRVVQRPATTTYSGGGGGGGY